MSVEYLHLPDTDDKTGLDDFLMAGHTVDDLYRRVKPTPPLAEPGGGPSRPPGQVNTGERPQRVRLDDAHIAQYIAESTLSGSFCWCASRGWMRYTGTHWVRTTDAAVGERVRQANIALHTAEARNGADADRLKAISALFAANRIRAIVGLAKGILEVRDDEFDSHPNLLNVGNGVVHLRTGALAPHDPALMLTKYTAVDYRPGATHPDWTTALKALPRSSAQWMQQRLGQAATGHPTPDDIMPVLQGSGANGKTTMITPVMRALGSYAVAVPERVLLANPSDHPTELMTLRGTRLAVLEETPEARHLNVKRLKDVLGTETMTARHIAKDTVSWHPTHSLVLSTNYRPRVDETDHGTWRRLALVRFPYRFRKPGEPIVETFDREGDPTLRDRLKRGDDGQHEAVLAWIVAGAVAWYRNGRVLPLAPSNVAADTRAWREDSDPVLGFVAEHLVREKNTHVMSTDLLAAFNGWLKVRGHREWSDQTLAGRLKDHEAWQGITYQQILASKDGLSRPTWPAATIPKRYRAWVGVRFGVSTDEQDDDPKPVETDTKPQDAQGAPGTPENPHEEPKIKTPDHPVHPVQSNVSRPNGSAYLNGQCRDCGKRPHSAGRPRCDECYRAYLITIDGYDR